VIQVRVRKGENLDEALERFERKVAAEGVLRDILRRLHYQKPSEASRAKSKRHLRYGRAL
jgi:small subunit ribosomal protein S21